MEKFGRPLSLFEQLKLQKLQEQDEMIKDYTFWQQIKFVLSQGDFVLLMIGLTSLFLVISGVQFWFTSYLEEVIGVS